MTSFNTLEFCRTFGPILQNPLFHHIQILFQTSDDHQALGLYRLK